MQGRRSVLVIEDHEDTRHMVETMLECNGFAAVGAENGVYGLRALHEHRPSIILLDLSMPVMDGWTFRREQLQLTDQELARVPVIVMSALSDCHNQGRSLGVAAVLPKPIDIDHLLRVIHTHAAQ